MKKGEIGGKEGEEAGSGLRSQCAEKMRRKGPRGVDLKIPASQKKNEIFVRT